jgi:hypothetical protein
MKALIHWIILSLILATLFSQIFLFIYFGMIISDEKKQELVIEYYIKTFDATSPFEDTSGVKLIGSEIITKNNILYEKTSTLLKQDDKIVKIITNPDLDISTFDIAEPKITDHENNSLKRQLDSQAYYKTWGDRRSSGSRLRIDTFFYHFYKDKDSIFWIDTETTSEKETRIQKEKNLTTLQNIVSYHRNASSNFFINEPNRLKIKTLMNATPQNWQLLNEYYSKTDTLVFFKGQPLYSYSKKIYADPITFRIIESITENKGKTPYSEKDIIITTEYRGQDKNGIWSNGYLQE